VEGFERQPQGRVAQPRSDELGAVDAPAFPGRDFPGRAEALRRAGEPDAALRLARPGLAHDPARVEGHVAEALALLDLHQPEVARLSLARALEAAGCTPPPPAPAFEAGFDALGDSELDSAFADASPERDSMIDADGIAFEAMRAARLDEPESVKSRRRSTAVGIADEPQATASAPVPAGFEDVPAGFAADSPFQTRTMAELLERQGDPESARVIRTQLEQRSGETDTQERRAAVIERLERWLVRLRGGDA
jgi:hypothetical protein